MKPVLPTLTSRISLVFASVLSVLMLVSLSLTMATAQPPGCGLSFFDIQASAPNCPGEDGFINVDVDATASAATTFTFEVFEPATGAWRIAEENTTFTLVTINVPVGEGYGVRVTDNTGCVLDSLGIDVPVGGYTIDSVVVASRGCALGDDTLSVLRAYVTYPDASFFFVYVETIDADGNYRRFGSEDYGESIQDIRDVPPGTYAVGVEGGSSFCSPPADTDSLRVTLNPGTTAAGLEFDIDYNCFDDNFDVTPIGPSPGADFAEFSLNGGPFEAFPTYQDLAIGTYTVDYREASSMFCESVQGTFTLDTIGYTLSIASVTDAISGPNSGSVVFTDVVAEAGPRWSLDNVNFQSSRTFGGLAAGSYTGYLLTYSDDCSYEVPFAIGGSTCSIEREVTISDSVSCSGAADASITIAVTGPGTYEYNVNDGPYQANNTFGGLAPNLYIFGTRAVGGAGCEVRDTIVVVEPAKLSAAFEDVSTSCGQDNGSIAAFPFGGTSPYTYLWSTGATGGLIEDLAPGTYSVTVTDAKGYTFAETFVSSPRQATNSYCSVRPAPRQATPTAVSSWNCARWRPITCIPSTTSDYAGRRRLQGARPGDLHRVRRLG